MSTVKALQEYNSNIYYYKKEVEMSSSGTGRSKSSNGTRPTPPLNNISSINNNTQAPPNYRTSSNTRPNIRGSSVAVPEKRKIVGQYMLGKTIGEGTFGKVKLAIHIPTGEKVTIWNVLRVDILISIS